MSQPASDVERSSKADTGAAGLLLKDTTVLDVIVIGDKG
jgi:hypothetical protein